ncbi:MAG: phosphoribosylformylglycinamidine cyclo-ligase [Halobacteriales archaeon]
MDYSDAGVDVEASDAAVAALADAVDIEHGDYAGLVELDGRVLGLTTDGCGTKVLVAEAVGDYSTIGVDAVAMNANDLVAMNLRPLAFVDYLVVDEPSESLSREIGVGLRKGCESAGMRLVGGETAVMPEVVEGVDLAGSCVGVAAPDDVVDGSGVREGDAVVGLPSSGVHSNGLTLARKALTSEFDYDDRVPYADRSVGEELLTPTRIYGDVPDVAREHDVRGMAHVTGGGFTNLSRISEHRYVVDDPLPVPEVFGLVADAGDVDRREMYRTFNMGMGFALVVEAGDADDVAEALDGSVVGYVDDGEGVEVDGLEV